MIRYIGVFIISMLIQHIAIALALTMMFHIDVMTSYSMLCWDLTAGAFISYAIAYEEYLKDKDETSNG